MLTRPLSKRPAAGYQRAFLDAYKPNITFYLSEMDRRIFFLCAQEIPLEDRARFIEFVEEQLRALHIGNIAIYKIEEAQFELWHSSWH